LYMVVEQRTHLGSRMLNLQPWWQKLHQISCHRTEDWKIMLPNSDTLFSKMLLCKIVCYKAIRWSSLLILTKIKLHSISLESNESFPYQNIHSEIIYTKSARDDIFWRILSPQTWHYVFWYMFPNVSNECTIPIFTLLPWWWRQNIPLKSW
jgi:hypothetical protein